MKAKKPAWPAYTVVSKPLKWLKPFENNPKHHPESQVQQLRAAIDEWGWTIPVLADPDGELIAGHGRVLAAQLDPPIVDPIPVIIAKGWTDAQKRAYRIADNKLTELGGWSERSLKIEFADLKVAGFDLALTGFDMPTINGLLGNVGTLGELPGLPSGDKSPFEQITFTLHTSQVLNVRKAMKAADAMGSYGGSPNDNKNGNAIARVCAAFLKSRAQPKAKKKAKR